MDMGQLLITVGREYGSGGREIAEKLGQRLGITVYDRNMLDELQQRYGFDRETLARSEESPVNVLFSRKIRGFSSSVEEVVAQREFELIAEKADEGQSFIVVGRCGEQVLHGRAGLHTFFIRGQESIKCHRIMQKQGIGQEEALAKMRRMDHQRKMYHNYYCDGKWGDSRNYDLCVNSSALGVDGAVELLYQFLQLSQQHNG
jgi:cytidylate kinase